LIGSHRILRNEYLESAAEEPSGRSLISIQEGIQQRIASDLHDSTCQHLIAASLGLMRVRAGIGGSAVNERLCDDIEASLDAALREIRAFAYLLHPQNLTADGLKATIEQYAQGFASRTSLRVSHAVSSDVDRLPYEKQRSLLRVVQEALANVFRHARATEVKIVLDATDSHFRLTISDNGRGLSTGARSMGVGIPAMRARLEQIGGTLDIRSDPATRPSGTVLRAVFPHGLAMKRSRRKPVTVSVGTE
jgi:signal transduction histidine kinase